MMKKTSKLMSLVIAGAMVLSMTACGGNTAETTAAATQAQETAADTAAQAEETTAGTEDGTAAQAEGTTYKIGVLQLVQHTALDAANEGFIAALDDAGIAYEVDQQNASGDQSACQTVASKFANEKKDLILAIATPAAQAMVGAVEDTPVLVTAVTDPAESGLVDTNEKPGANVTGTSDLTPVKEQIDLLYADVVILKVIGCQDNWRALLLRRVQLQDSG
jgi:putative ABC transport system substrate-binding protein